MDGQYLAFVDEIGRSVSGDYMYRLDFTEDSEIVCGDYFNIVPALIVPNLQPDIKCLSLQAKFLSPIKLTVAKKNPCFSMQDCIDGIISLCFSEITDKTLYYNDEPFHLDFGTPYDKVKEILDGCGIEMFDQEEVKNGDESEIDDLIDRLGDDDGEDGDGYEYDDLDPTDF